jgi:hypothetical protein
VGEFMKYLYLFLLAILVITFPVIAQDDELDELDFEMQDYEQFEDEATPYFAIGGGPVLNMLFLDFDEINNFLSSTGYNLGNEDFKLDGILYQFGAQGVISIGLVDNVRIGVIGMGGKKSPKDPLDLKVPDISGDSVDVKRFLDFYSGYTGITLDYEIVPFKNFNFAIVPGITLGWGILKLECYQTQSGINWKDYNPGNDGVNFSSTMQTSFWNAIPKLSFEYSPTFLSMFRASIGYSTSFGYDWYLNNNGDAKVKDVPAGINTNGLTIQLAILLGIFNY